MPGSNEAEQGTNQASVPMTNLHGILSRPDIMFFMLTDARTGYHNLKLDEQSSYLTTLSCPFGRYRYI